jgi:hypothetical protein
VSKRHSIKVCLKRGSKAELSRWRWVVSLTLRQLSDWTRWIRRWVGPSARLHLRRREIKSQSLASNFTWLTYPSTSSQKQKCCVDFYKISKVKGAWSTIHNEQRQDLYSSPNIKAKKRRTKMAVLCSLVDTDLRFRGPYCLHHQGDESVSSSETSVNTYQNAVQHRGRQPFLYSSPWEPEISRRMMNWTWYATHMGEMRNVYKILVWKPERDRPFRRYSLSMKMAVFCDITPCTASSVGHELWPWIFLHCKTQDQSSCSTELAVVWSKSIDVCEDLTASISKLLWNVGLFLPDYTVQHLRRQPSSTDNKIISPGDHY